MNRSVGLVLAVCALAGVAACGGNGAELVVAPPAEAGPDLPDASNNNNAGGASIIPVACSRFPNRGDSKTDRGTNQRDRTQSGLDPAGA